MKKFVPYILILAFVIVGFFANKEILSRYHQNGNGYDNKSVNKSSNINDQFETMLIYPKKNELSEFNLWDFNQETFSKTNFEGRWNLIFTGYTNCPDICPNTLNDMTHLYSKLKEASRKRFQFTFFSVDPNRDTPQRMKSYLDNFHSDFIGISGKKEEIDNVIHQLGGIYSLNTDEGEYYSVDHSGRIFIVDPMSRRYGILKAEALHSKNKDQLVKELESLL